MTYRIEAPHFVAAVTAEAGRVTKAAPIVGYMRGLSVGRVLSYCARMGWTCELLPPHAAAPARPGA